MQVVKDCGVEVILNISVSGFRGLSGRLSRILDPLFVDESHGYEIIDVFSYLVMKSGNKYVVGLASVWFNLDVKLLDSWEDVVKWLSQHLRETFVIVRKVKVDNDGNTVIVDQYDNVLNDYLVGDVIKEIIRRGSCDGMQYWWCVEKEGKGERIVSVARLDDGWVGNGVEITVRFKG